jgi:aminoglycoside phosphotransferase
MWGNGATASTVSRSPTRSPLATWRTEVTRLAWVSSTPLGSPVVPLE